MSRRFLAYLVLSVIVLGVGFAVFTWLRPAAQPPISSITIDGRKIQLDIR